MNDNRDYLHSMTAGALLPFAQATGIAAASAISTLITSWIVFDAIDPLKIALIVFTITWIYMLVKLFRHWLKLTSIETFIQQDINGDGVIGEPEPQPAAAPRRVVIQIDTVKENGHYQVGDESARVEFPCDDAQLDALAAGLLNGLSFSERAWTGKGKPFTTEQFRALRDVMKAHDLTEYVNEKDPRQGIKLTEKGRALMAEIANTSPTLQE